MENLVLIDGNSLINRAFYAMPLLSTKDGTYTNAVYGFTNMLFRIILEHKPTFVAVAFDLKAPTFRHKMYADYKAGRKVMPEELRSQIPLLKDLLRLMKIAVYEKEGSEADDIIGTIAKHTDVRTLIFTGDRDALQLVDQSTEVHFTKRGITETEIYNNDNFFEKVGITPAQIIELKSLMGDSSDNIPGVVGVGEKTALTLIQKYGDLENVLSHTFELAPKLCEKIIKDTDNAHLSRTLATIDCDCGVDTNMENMKFSLPLPAAAHQKIIDLSFKTLANRTEFFESTNAPVQEQTSAPTEEQKPLESMTVADMFSEMQVVHTVTPLTPKRIIRPNSPEELVGKFVGKPVAMTVEEKRICLYADETEYILPVMKGLIDWGFNLSEILYSIRTVFESSTPLILFNKKETRHLLSNLDMDVTCECDDVSILKYLSDFSPKDMSVSEVISAYGLDDGAPACALMSIYLFLKERLKEEQMEHLYYDLELPLSDVLYDMETQGFKIDYNALSEMGSVYKERISALETQIKEIAENPALNVNSPKQIGDLLFEQLKLGKGKKNRHGYSTTAEILEEIENAHPVVPLILKHRRLQKIYSTYIEGFKPLIDTKTGIIKTSFNQTVTSTGRLSSKEPNLQNIPVRDEEGKELRKFFVPRDSEHILIGADYSQIELRLLADFSNCQGLINAFKDGKDIHLSTASRVFRVPPEKVTPDLRRAAKAVNFGIIYGISDFGLSKNINTSVKVAREYIQSYFNEYPEVKAYMEANVSFARKTGYSITLLGRRRYIKEIRSMQYATKSFGERAAMNMPLQGSSADIIKVAMLGVYRRLKNEGLKSKLILQVHDELIIDALKSEERAVSKILVEEMENAVKLKVQLPVELGKGETWYDAK